MNFKELDFNQLKTEHLLKIYKLFKFAGMCCVVIALIYLVLVLIMFAFLSGGMPLAVGILLGVVGGALFGFFSYYSIKRMKELKKILDTREISDEIKQSVDKSLKKILLASIVAIIAGVVFFVSLIVSDSSSSYAEKRDGECSSCGRTWSAGDIGGNYINIARTGMCNNCENNYHDMKGYLD